MLRALAWENTMIRALRWLLPVALIAVAPTAVAFVAGTTPVFINELHYDNVDVDVGEAVEIAGPAGTSLSGWTVVLYNGSNGTVYDTIALSGSIPNLCGGFGVVTAFPGGANPQIQNGAPDGLALVDGSTVVQFLSYEGTFTATNGPAQGLLSTDMGVSEGSNTPIGHSLALTGHGTGYADFAWQPPTIASFGACNPGQSFTPAVDAPPELMSMTPANGATGISPLPTLHTAFSEAVDLAPGAISLSCTLSGNVALTITGADASYQAIAQSVVQNLDTCTATVTGALVTDRDGTVHAMVGNVSHSFTIQPDLPPTISSHQPAADAGGVAHAANIVVDFSEPVTTQPGWLKLSCDTSGVISVSISGGNQQFLANPDSDFAALETCTVLIDADLVLDQDGTPTPMTSDYSWHFTSAGDSGDYYASVDASSATTLRQTLHDLIDDHQWFPYSDNDPDVVDTWIILEEADEDPANTNRILDVYRNESMTKFGGGQGPYNREHTWPNSLGFPSSGGSHAYTDTHMLMLSHVGYNSNRGHKYFGTCNASCTERTTLVNDGQGGGSGVYPGNSNWYNGTLWETWRGRRGDVARAMMYMDVRYEGGTHSNGWHEPDLILTNNASQIQGTNTANNGTGRAYMGLLSVILAWHEQDPPDAKEHLRNEVVYSYQGNRNPFIDHPEWAACLFLDQCPTPSDAIFADGFED